MLSVSLSKARNLRRITRSNGKKKKDEWAKQMPRRVRTVWERWKD